MKTISHEFGTTLASSDWHLWCDDRLDLVKEFCGVVRERKPEVLVFDGDLADEWKGNPGMNPWHVLVTTQSWTEVRRLTQQRANEGLFTVWVRGNHDSAAKDGYLPGVEICDRFMMAPFEFRHGWEFDIVWGGLGGIPGVQPLAWWLAENHPELALNIWQWLHSKTGADSPRQQMKGMLEAEEREEVTLLDEWTLHVGLIHTRAMQYAMANKVRLVMGHTHNPMSYGDVLYDCGDMENSFSYLWINGDVSKRTKDQVEIH